MFGERFTAFGNERENRKPLSKFMHAIITTSVIMTDGFRVQRRWDGDSVTYEAVRIIPVKDQDGIALFDEAVADEDSKGVLKDYLIDKGL